MKRGIAVGLETAVHIEQGTDPQSIRHDGSVAAAPGTCNLAIGSVIPIRVCSPSIGVEMGECGAELDTGATERERGLKEDRAAAFTSEKEAPGTPGGLHT